MMISLLKRSSLSAVVAALAVTMAACTDERPAPTAVVVAPDAQMRHSSNDCDDADSDSDGRGNGSTGWGNLPKCAPVFSARLMVKRDGGASFQVNTGSYDLATLTATPNGYLKKVQYTLYLPGGKKKVWKREVKLDERQQLTAYEESLPASILSGVAPIDIPRYVLKVQVQLKDVLDKGKRTDVEREINAPVIFFPDVDLTVGTGDGEAHPIKTMRDVAMVNDPIPLQPVQYGTFGRYGLTIGNSGPIQRFFDPIVGDTVERRRSLVGVQVKCVATLDDQPIAPANIRYYYINASRPAPNDSINGPDYFLSPDSTAICRFDLKVDQVGKHKLTVNVRAIHPVDYDTTNNVVSDTIVIQEDPPAGGGDGGDEGGGTVSVPRPTLRQSVWFNGAMGTGSPTGIKAGQSLSIAGISVAETEPDMAGRAYALEVKATSNGAVIYEGTLSGTLQPADITGQYCIQSDGLNGGSYTATTAHPAGTLLVALCASQTSTGNQRVGASADWLVPTNQVPPGFIVNRNVMVTVRVLREGVSRGAVTSEACVVRTVLPIPVPPTGTPPGTVSQANYVDGPIADSCR